MTTRIGIGYDIHQLVEGRKLFLGGIEIPYIKGLLGHSDADALLHALCDALLGALACGDIGEHFPDTDPQYQGISSVRLLEETCKLVQQKQYAIGNVDLIVIAQEPNLSPFKKQMREKISQVLGIGPDQICLKAKTNEGMDAAGRKEAIACYAAVTLMRQ